MSPAPTHEVEFAFECLVLAGRTVADRTKPWAVFDTQAALTGRWDKWSEPAEVVRPGRTWAVERQVVEAGVGRQVEPAVGRQSAAKEPVVGGSVVLIVLGRFVGVVRSVESQFVGVLAVGC